MRVENLIIKNNHNYDIEDKCKEKGFIKKLRWISDLFKTRVFCEVELLDSAEMENFMLENKILAHPDVCSFAFDNKVYVDYNKAQKDFCKTVLHEYVHVCVFNTRFDRCAEWVNEGIAIVLADQSLVEICPETYDELMGDCLNVEFFYNKSVYVIRRLIDRFGLYDLIQAEMRCTDFASSPIFGKETVTAMIEDRGVNH